MACVSGRLRRGGRDAGGKMKKICPILITMKDTEDKECSKESCAWWDVHYNCCAILSTAVLLEILVKRKDVTSQK